MTIQQQLWARAFGANDAARATNDRPRENRGRRPSALRRGQGCAYGDGRESLGRSRGLVADRTHCESPRPAPRAPGADEDGGRLSDHYRQHHSNRERRGSLAPAQHANREIKEREPVLDKFSAWTRPHDRTRPGFRQALRSRRGRTGQDLKGRRPLTAGAATGFPAAALRQGENGRTRLPLGQNGVKSRPVRQR
jgi:hypothetical protein